MPIAYCPKCSEAVSFNEDSLLDCPKCATQFASGPIHYATGLETKDRRAASRARQRLAFAATLWKVAAVMLSIILVVVAIICVWALLSGEVLMSATLFLSSPLQVMALAYCLERLAEKGDE